MTEKRFTLMENISAYDGRVISEYVLDNEKRLTFEEVVDLLNSLVDENEQLRQQLANYELAKKDLIKRLNDRKKEDFERFFK